MPDVQALADLNVSPGSTVVVRDEEWLVTNVVETSDGKLLHVQGLSELVRGTTAQFFASLDDIEVLDPAQARVTADASPGYRLSRLWVEATLRKTPVPITDNSLTVSPHMLADQLPYQASAIRQALDPDNLRPRILLADAVGLGKTIEIGMILAELVRRGRGERILVVTPRHVLEQMQHELWTRFALPLVRLDSAGIQRVRQKLPATRNPFTYYKRAIISVDTLKSDKYMAYLRAQKWDAVVIDESHNLTNSGTLNNRLARTLAPTTDALTLASATPHNGKDESFANLVRLLEPTAIRPDGTPHRDDARRLIIRRHRNSPEVASTVGSSWAPRKDPQHQLVPASAAEDAVALELEQTWLHPASGKSPYSGKQDSLFGWTLAKAFLSSPHALIESVDNRLTSITKNESDAANVEREALNHLRTLASASLDASAKFAALVDYLKHIGVGKGSSERAVVFGERVATLNWLGDALHTALGLPKDAVAVMHGALSDEEQMRLIESFKQAHSPLRVLVTGDVASEGVNLHAQCHELIHYDIPWSLIRIEQRNGRIDRYGQLHAPQITTLILEPTSERFRGDLRVLRRLLEREHAAHKALGDVASLMDEFDIGAEEETIKQVLAGKKDFDQEVLTPEQAVATHSITDLLNSLDAAVANASNTPDAVAPESYLYGSTLDYLRDALDAAFIDKAAPLRDVPGQGGVEWREFPSDGIVQLTPPRDLRQRLDALPQTYLADREVHKSLKLAVTKTQGQAELTNALNDKDGSSWPAAHYLGPIHPVVEWATDRALASLERNHVFAMRGTVDVPTVLLVGTLTNRRGQVVAVSHVSAMQLAPSSPSCAITVHASMSEMLSGAGITMKQANPGSITGADALQPLVAMAVRDTHTSLATHLEAASAATTARVNKWAQRTEAWDGEASLLDQSAGLKTQRASVKEVQALIDHMRPDRYLVRPLLVVVPHDHGNEA